MVEDSATLPSSNSRDLNTPLTTLPPLIGPVCVSRRRIGPGFITRREHILDGRHGPGRLRTVLASIAYARPCPWRLPSRCPSRRRCRPLCGYLPPRLREPLAPRSGSVHFRLGSSCFSYLKTFQCD